MFGMFKKLVCHVMSYFVKGEFIFLYLDRMSGHIHMPALVNSEYRATGSFLFYFF